MRRVEHNARRIFILPFRDRVVAALNDEWHDLF